MTSPFEGFVDELERVLEALTPPDRATVLYRYVQGTQLPSGSTADRLFWLEGPSIAEKSAEAGTELTEYRLDVALKLYLVNDAYDVRARAKRVQNEGALIMRALDAHPEVAWGVSGLETRGYSLASARKTNHVILTFPLSVWTQEA